MKPECDVPQQDDELFNLCMQALNIEPHALDLIMLEVQKKLTDMEAEGVL